ncbi:hypothetical protein [Streptomyces sp. CJ_13]|uniref:hypothetical protein n=1 Tax=Streptomyces sp. CJ_13 TaxID=2724943 RepID=UPI0025428E01|nr:hypothetical protein [Streptomyces sp. CJ_13]
MPKTDVTRVRAQRGTIALFVTAAVLAVVGIALFLGLGGAERPAASGPSARPTAPPATATASSSGSAGPTVESPAAESSEPPVASEPSPLPAPLQEAARAFTTAWASHDARPGRDTSFDDASRRAAAYADGDLAEDLRTHTGGSAGRQQWLNWRDRQVQVTVTVLRVSLPDGAPTPSEASGFARVIYKLTETPASGPATESEEHVALKLRRGADGSWRVVGLPNV